MESDAEASRSLAGSVPMAWGHRLASTLGTPSLLGLAALLGYAAWGHAPFALAAAPLLAWLWARAGNRLAAGGIAGAYYLSAMRDVPASVFVFFGDDASWGSGYFLWLAAGTLLALPWALLWRRRAGGWAWRLPLVLALVALPPLGIIGTANPLTAAGVLLPGTAWLGLILATALMAAYVRAARGGPAAFALVAACHLAGLAYGLAYREPSFGWEGLKTSFGRLDKPGTDLFQRAYFVHRKLLDRLAEAPSGATLVFPENVVGPWTSAAAGLWASYVQEEGARSSKHALVSAMVEHGDGSFESILVAIGGGLETVYAQRVPVPISMWRPFAGGGARTHWWDSGVFPFAGRRVAALVCYEQLLVWPVLFSFAADPEVLVAPANVWWARDSSIPLIQEAALRAWARLFGVPLVMAVNR